MQPKKLPNNRVQYDFTGKKVAEKFFAVVKAAQEETIREYVRKAAGSLWALSKWLLNAQPLAAPS